MKGDALVLPHLASALGGRKWLEEFAPAPRNKQVQRRIRNAYIDSVLAVLRALHDTMLLSIVSFGEGALVVVGVLCPELRRAACRERRVSDHESETFEDLFWDQWRRS